MRLRAGIASAALALTSLAPGTVAAPTGVLVTVPPILEVIAPSVVTHPVLRRGRTSGAVAFPVRVVSNLPAGYAVGIRRAAFPAAGMLVRVSLAGPPASGQLRNLPAGATTVPLTPAAPLQIGHRAGTITTAAGDLWATSLTFGPADCADGARGVQSQTATLTVIATSRGHPKVHTDTALQVPVRCRGDD